MNAPHTHHVQHAWDPRRPESTSDVPCARPPTSIEAALPHPAADVGGLDAIPQDLLSEDERAEVEFDLAGLDQAWPGEDAGERREGDDA